MGNLSQLESLSLHRNQLTGPVPFQLGNLVKLTRLRLNDNQLSGNIPAALGNLSSLTFLRLAGTNQFTGCVPSGLRGVADNDLADLGLPFC